MFQIGLAKRFALAFGGLPLRQEKSSVYFDIDTSGAFYNRALRVLLEFIEHSVLK